MTPSQTLLTKVKTQHGLSSDWQLHKILGASIQTVRTAQLGRGELSADVVLVACDLIGEDPQAWLLRVELDRCRNQKRRETLRRILERVESAAGRIMPGFAALAVALI